MAKTIIKETGIVLLMISTIGLFFTIVFYDYIPNDKVVPIRIQPYSMSDEVKNELKGNAIEEQNVVRTYYIDSSDLTMYESTNNYDKGKVNPFADYSSSSVINSGTNSSTNSKTTKNSIDTDDDADIDDDADDTTIESSYSEENE